MHAQDEVVAFYYPLLSSVSEPSCGEIGLPDYGQAAASRAARISVGFTRRLVSSSLAQGNGNAGAPPDPRAISLHRKAPTGFEDPRSLASQSFLVCDVHGDRV
jgi:hypothetical protein